MKKIILLLLVASSMYQVNYANEGSINILEALGIQNQNELKEKLKNDDTIDLKDYNVNEILISAIYDGDLEFIQLLINHGAKIEDYNALIYQAIYQENLEIVKILVPFVTNQHVKNRALFILCNSSIIDQREESKVKRLKIAELLIGNGANMNPGESPLAAAAKHNNLLLIPLLLDNGIDVNSKLNDGHYWYTALYFATKNKNLDMVNILLAHQANPNLIADGTSSPLDNAIVQGDILIAKALLAANAMLSEYSLFRAVQSGSIEAVQLILDTIQERKMLHRYKMLNTDYSVNLNPLEEAIRRNNAPITKLLLDSGITYEDSEKNNLLHLAAKYNSLNIAKMLLPDDENHKIVDADEHTNKKQVSSSPYNYYSYVDIRNVSNDTPLHIAAKYGSLDVARLLIDNKANIFAENDRKETPMILAFFMDKNVTPSNSLSYNPRLRKIILRNKLLLIKFLADKGANYNYFPIRDNAISSFIKDLSENKLKQPQNYLNL